MGAPHSQHRMVAMAWDCGTIGIDAMETGASMSMDIVAGIECICLLEDFGAERSAQKKSPLTMMMIYAS